MTEEIYRPCASIAVVRPHGDGYQILLVHKPRKKDACSAHLNVLR